MLSSECILRRAPHDTSRPLESTTLLPSYSSIYIDTLSYVVRSHRLWLQALNAALVLSAQNKTASGLMQLQLLVAGGSFLLALYAKIKPSP